MYVDLVTSLASYSSQYHFNVQSKARGSFPAERIKAVINTDTKVFKKGTLTSPDRCFQVTIFLLHALKLLLELSCR